MSEKTEQGNSVDHANSAKLSNSEVSPIEEKMKVKTISEIVTSENLENHSHEEKYANSIYCLSIYF